MWSQLLRILFLVLSRNLSTFMEPESSVPCSQELTTGSCVTHLSPVHILAFSFGKFHTCLGLKSDLFPSIFAVKILNAIIISYMLAICSAHLTASTWMNINMYFLFSFLGKYSYIFYNYKTRHVYECLSEDAGRREESWNYVVSSKANIVNLYLKI
jgi:hypothetical protein